MFDPAPLPQTLRTTLASFLGIGELSKETKKREKLANKLIRLHDQMTEMSKTQKVQWVLISLRTRSDRSLSISTKTVTERATRYEHLEDDVSKKIGFTDIGFSEFTCFSEGCSRSESSDGFLQLERHQRRLCNARAGPSASHST